MTRFGLYARVFFSVAAFFALLYLGVHMGWIS